MNLLRLIAFRKPPGGGLDPDASAFLTAIGNTDPTIEAAINDLVVDLKNYGLWTKMKAVYPVVGGTATSHSYNLINTSQYQVTWNGTLTHNSSGVTGDGSTGYGATGLFPNSILSQNSAHISSYASIVSSGAGFLDMGSCTDFSQTDKISFGRYYGGTTYYGVNQSAWDTTSATNFSPWVGLATASRVGGAGSDLQLYLNSTSKATGSTSSSGLSDKQIYLCGYNYNNTTNSLSANTYSWFSVGDGLSGTEVGSLYTAVQAFQTTLGRQV